MCSLRRAGAVLVAVLLGCAHCPAASAASAPQLLLGQDFPDPDVVKTGSGYLAFSTTAGAGKIPVASAPAPEGPWRIVGDALGSVPKWAKPDGGFWAPDVSEAADGTFVLYFAASRLPNGPMCVGTATSAQPAGPYQPDRGEPLVCVPADGGDIDPQTFLDSDGSRHLLYKANGAASGPPAAIWSQKLSPDGRTLSGSRTELLRADLSSEKNVVEAPAMVKTSSRYLLFYSADTFQSSGYHTGYATAPTLAGPFVKADAPFLSTERLGGAVDGPGGADVVDGNIYFHGWLNGGRQARGLYRLPIRFPGDIPQLG
ncbi:family 43 glycosylhydrolase [Amycolatopsis rubida]|uniref:Family 43 glycosylhydrolase n=1 Tax=Amycolatopsis rubida TaxID=112413 RepID=A0ABX0BLK5_9PSEU|nr:MULTISPECIES: glycoside hydrolase family 43 protein [Amycolatopsis]MYW90720.1 family 43 glycosylhydrolase [Amycolatopsis rubida]NEC55703.1 family 43 glycosylhydrolase [Amycolatopsis rubida]OAP21795.1 Extracellular endo-alpha-(1->5)-L-arabinanase 1 precursor [Amycolatopsis sp. M39]